VSDYGVPVPEFAGPPRADPPPRSGHNKTLTSLAVAITVLVVAVAGEVLVIRRPVATEPLATTTAEFQKAANAACLADYRALLAPARRDGNNEVATIDLEAAAIVQLSASVNAAPHPPADFAWLDQVRVLSARLAADLRRNANKMATAGVSRSVQKSIFSQTTLLQQNYLGLGLKQCVAPSVRGAPVLLD
jgi:hypothetical protein